MTLRNLLTVSSILGLLFGLGAVLAPGPVTSLYGANLNLSGTVVAQFYGAALIGLGTLGWLARDFTDAQALRAVVLSSLIADTIGFLVALLGQLAGGANSLGWSTVVIYLLLALGFAYFQFVKPIKS
ncbi:MAG: hypothetical protein HY259_06760 [Chloroflexi bacterium]|nr:hypothetical protein [Chloroflexota bacterium]